MKNANGKNRKIGPQRIPQVCLSCDSPKGYVAMKDIHIVPFKGEEFELACVDLVCPDCKEALVDNDEINRRLKALVMLYQKRHNYLTGEQVKKRRIDLGYKTQESFVSATELVSSATLKRLESGGWLQEVTTDRILRDEFERLEQASQKSFEQKVLNLPLKELEPVIEEATSSRQCWTYGFLQTAACVSILATHSLISDANTNQVDLNKTTLEVCSC